VADHDSLTTELEDSDQPRAGMAWRRLDFSRLLGANALRRLTGIVVALLIVFWPGRSELILGRLVGIGLVGSAAFTLWAIRRTRPVAWLVVLASLVALGVGGLLIVFPARTEVALGRILGIGLITAGAIGITRAVRRRGQTDFGWAGGSPGPGVGQGGGVGGFAHGGRSKL